MAASAPAGGASHAAVAKAAHVTKMGHMIGMFLHVVLFGASFMRNRTRRCEHSGLAASCARHRANHGRIGRSAKDEQ
jgi:hypothetical protein